MNCFAPCRIEDIGYPTTKGAMNRLSHRSWESRSAFSEHRARAASERLRRLSPPPAKGEIFSFFSVFFFFAAERGSDDYYAKRKYTAHSTLYDSYFLFLPKFQDLNIIF